MSRTESSRERSIALATQAIVVRRFDWSESSRLVHLVTPELGLVKVRARGVHRHNSPWRGLFDHFHLLQVAFRYRSEQEYQMLDRAELRETASRALFAEFPPL